MSAFFRRLASLFSGVLLATTCSTDAYAQVTHRVDLMHDLFMPDDLTIRLRDTVHWVWLEDFHNVESGVVEKFVPIPDLRFRSGDPEFGQAFDETFDVTFDRAFLDAFPSPDSVYPYYCIVHYFTGMVGAIEVVVPGDADLDTDVDLLDHGRTVDCLAGPGDDPPDDCTTEELRRIDADADGDVDLRDFAEFQNLFAG